MSARTFETLHWQWCHLEELSARKLHAVFAAREAVFVVEQQCPYQELDELDFDAYHLIAWENTTQRVAAYLRVLPPHSRFPEPSLGRVLTTACFRGQGLGQALVRKGLMYFAITYPEHATRISAQTYLERFYGSFGFSAVSNVYLEDGIPHVEMVRAPLA